MKPKPATKILRISISLLIGLLFLIPLQKANALSYTYSTYLIPNQDYGSTSFFAYQVKFGDINGDGFKDIVVTENAYQNYTGRLYVFYGGSEIDSDPDVIIVGNNSDDRFGGYGYSSSLEIIDIDNDGYDDILTGAYRDDDYGTNSGIGVIFFGSDDISGNYNATDADVVFPGNTTDKYGFGAGITSGFYNNDEYLDIAIASAYSNSNEGDIHIYYGNGTKNIDTDEDLVLSASGSYVLGIGTMSSIDFNNDGYDDIFAGDFSSTNKIYLFYMGPSEDTSYDAYFAPSWGTYGALYNCSITDGDINKDGYSDICMSFGSGAGSPPRHTSCYFGSNTKYSGVYDHLDPDIYYELATSGESTLLDDINNDGNTDLLVQDLEGINLARGDGESLGTLERILPKVDVDGTISPLGQLYGPWASFAEDITGDGYKEVFFIAARSGGTNINHDAGMIYIYKADASDSEIIISSSEVTNESSYQISGNFTYTDYSVSNVQWSTSSLSSGTWSNCTASDGAFDSLTESFICDIGAFQSDGTTNLYLRSINANGFYIPSQYYGNLNVLFDPNKPNDNHENTDHEIVKVGGEDIDDKGSKDQEGNEIGRGYSNSNKPKIEFEKIGDDLSGVDKYEIRLTNTNDGLSTKDGEDYLWIDDIPHEGDDGEKRERDGVEIEYKGDRIKVDPKDNKYRLDDGAYYMFVRSYDNAGNFNDSNEVKIYVGDDKENDNDEENENGSNNSSDQSEITLEKIGTIPYDSKYSTYYYTSNNLTLSGTGTEGYVVLKINDEEASNAETIDGRFSIGSTLSTGNHKIEINGIVFSLVVDPTRELFPESLK